LMAVELKYLQHASCLDLGRRNRAGVARHRHVDVPDRECLIETELKDGRPIRSLRREASRFCLFALVWRQRRVEVDAKSSVAGRTRP